MTEIIPKLSSKLAQNIRKHHEGAASEAVLKFALVVVLNTATIILAVLLATFFTGHLAEGALVLFLFALLRYVSGGAHLHSSDACTLISILIMIFLAHISFPYWSLGLIVNIITVIILLILAPKGIEEVRKLNSSHLIFYKWLSVAIVCANFYFQNSLVSATFFVQALTLTSPVYFMINKLERRGKHESMDC
jgi:accessory gene regulator B